MDEFDFQLLQILGINDIPEDLELSDEDLAFLGIEVDHDR